jgi:hypothetical protein
MQTDTNPDILERLRAAALGADDIEIKELEALLAEAADTIETLRTRSGGDDAPPAGFQTTMRSAFSKKPPR